MSLFRLPRIRLRRPVLHTRSRKLFVHHKEMARALVHERVAHFMQHYGLAHGITIGRIAIRNQRSRWGSCSQKGNLNFNYKIVFLKPELQDYIIVHEICHIKEFNHSQAFWMLVAETVPAWKQCRRELRILLQ